MIVKPVSEIVDLEALIPLDGLKPVVGVDWEEDDEELLSIRSSSIDRVASFLKYPINRSNCIIRLTLVNFNLDPDRIRKGFEAQNMPINSITKISRLREDGTEEDIDSALYTYNESLNKISFSNNIQHKKEGFTELLIYCDIGWDYGTLPAEVRQTIHAIAIEAYDKPDFPKSNSLLRPVCNYKFYN